MIVSFPTLHIKDQNVNAYCLTRTIQRERYSRAFVCWTCNSTVKLNWVVEMRKGFRVGRAKAQERERERERGRRRFGVSLTGLPRVTSTPLPAPMRQEGLRVSKDTARNNAMISQQTLMHCCRTTNTQHQAKETSTGAVHQITKWEWVLEMYEMDMVLH